MSDDKQQPNNEGTIANTITVTSGAFAGGKHGRATNIVYGSDVSQALAQAVQELQQALEVLNIPAEARDSINKDVTKLEAEAKKDQPDTDKVSGLLENIADKLKIVGIILSQVTALSGPAGKIAQLIGSSLKALGLGAG